MVDKKITKHVEPLDVFTCGLGGISNIEASAGTGKTWAICGLYLRLIAREGLKVDQVLVVTFTNVATAELKSRIRSRLVEVLAAMEQGGRPVSDPFAGKFLESIGYPGGDVSEVRNRLQVALNSFEDAAIYTIHSFCQRTLGEIPFAAVQPFNVEVEANDREVVRQVAADYWRRIVLRYNAREVRAIIEAGFKPDWLAGEMNRVLGKPLAKLVFPRPEAGADRDARRAIWLAKILLRLGPHAVRDAKRRRRVISYNDMLYNLYQALTGGRFPRLADEMRLRFPAVLIDEFQDTDPLQFEIFRSIYTGRGRLFLVGDPKQAIYAFRNADITTYLAAKRLASCAWTLSENQRSEEGLVSAMNTLFGANANVFAHPDIPYTPVSRGAKPLREISGDPEPRKSLSVWLFEPGSKTRPLTTGRAVRLCLDAAAREITRLLSGGAAGQIKIGEKPLEPRDIAVLVRTKAQGQRVKAALAAFGIASVDLSDSSVFETPEALEMERVLHAIVRPAISGRVRAALSTVLMGKTSRALADLDDSDIEWNHAINRMEQYRLIWLRSGFGAMWRKMMTEEKLIERVLPTPGGERRITNWMHLMELAVAAEGKHRTLESLLRWLSEKRSASGPEEEAELRLESDENLVRIVTKHRAKGLEWPIVFCPFIWQERGTSRNESKVYTYHRDDQLLIDYTKSEKAKKLQEEEERAERVRLIYVALTRAVNRCYIAAGPFWKTWGAGATDTTARKSILNWILAGIGNSPGIWASDKKATVASIHQSWRNLFEADQGIGQVEWPCGQFSPRGASNSKTTYRARDFERQLDPAWRLSSYSTLAASSPDGATAEPEARDYDVGRGIDEEINPEGAKGRRAEGTLPDIINFPAGTTAGHCLHAILEQIDFQAPRAWSRTINDVLRAYPAFIPDGNNGRQADMIQTMLVNVIHARLPGDFALYDVSRKKRLSELEFTFPVRHLESGALNALLAGFGRRVPVLSFSALEGYLRGFIDMVFEHKGKWYVLDWKSNKLGNGPADYARERLNEEMFRHAYELQGLIYLTALHRYLKVRFPGYDYRVHMGGMMYLFIRGVRPQWPSAGIWHDLPEPALMESLDDLFLKVAKRKGGKAL